MTAAESPPETAFDALIVGIDYGGFKLAVSYQGLRDDQLVGKPERLHFQGWPGVIGARGDQCIEAPSDLKVHVGKEGYQFAIAWDRQNQEGWHEVRFLKTAMLNRQSEASRARQTKESIDAISRLGAKNGLPELTSDMCFNAFFSKVKELVTKHVEKIHKGKIKWIVGIPTDILDRSYYTLAASLEHAGIEEFCFLHEAEAVLCSTIARQPVADDVTVYMVADLGSVTTDVTVGTHTPRGLKQTTLATSIGAGAIDIDDKFVQQCRSQISSIVPEKTGLSKVDELLRAETQPARSFYNAKALFDGGAQSFSCIAQKMEIPSEKMQKWFDEVLKDTLSLIREHVRQTLYKRPKQKVVVVLAGGLGSSNKYVKTKFDELVRPHPTVQVQQGKSVNALADGLCWSYQTLPASEQLSAVSIGFEYDEYVDDDYLPWEKRITMEPRAKRPKRTKSAVGAAKNQPPTSVQWIIGRKENANRDVSFNRWIGITPEMKAAGGGFLVTRLWKCLNKPHFQKEAEKRQILSSKTEEACESCQSDIVLETEWNSDDLVPNALRAERLYFTFSVIVRGRNIKWKARVWPDGEEHHWNDPGSINLREEFIAQPLICARKMNDLNEEQLEQDKYINPTTSENAPSPATEEAGNS